MKEGRTALEEGAYIQRWRRGDHLHPPTPHTSVSATTCLFHRVKLEVPLTTHEVDAAERSGPKGRYRFEVGAGGADHGGKDLAVKGGRERGKRGERGVRGVEKGGRVPRECLEGGCIETALVLKSSDDIVVDIICTWEKSGVYIVPCSRHRYHYLAPPAPLPPPPIASDRF